MNANLHTAIAQSHQQDLHREARNARLAGELPTRPRIRFSRLAALIPAGAHRTPTSVATGRAAQA